MEELADIKSKFQHFKVTFGARPFIPGEAKGPEHDSGPDEPGWRTSTAAEDYSLKLGPMGSLASGRVFGLEIAGQNDFQFSSKGGDQWIG